MPLPSLKFPLSVPLFTPTGIPPSGPQPEAPDFGFIWFVSVASDGRAGRLPPSSARPRRRWGLLCLQDP